MPEGAGWELLAPFAGFSLFVRDESVFTYFNGEAWADLAARLGVNTEPDDHAPVGGVRRSRVLARSEGSGDARVIVNKAEVDRTASFVFQ